MPTTTTLKAQPYAAMKPRKLKSIRPQQTVPSFSTASGGIHPPYAESYVRRVRTP
jgi:hypothetical protein